MFRGSLSLLLLLCAVSVAGADPVTVTIHRDQPDGTSRLAMGVTHTHIGLDPWCDPAAMERGKALLRDAVQYHNQHLMGWGAGNPNPAPGVYDWDRLDYRVNLLRSLGGTPVITLCAAPDWMKGGTPGQTDWKRIEAAPLPEHFADFAALAQQVARRYPDVKHFQVWNEMKGFWKPSANNWNYEAYTQMYNLVYDALKAVNPEIQVGGLYLVIEGTGSKRGDWATEEPIRARQWEVIDYWLKHKRGADFVCLDRGIRTFHDKATYTTDELMRYTHYFGEITRKIRARANLPIWWSEYYASGPKGSPQVTAMQASIMAHMLKAGASVALLWNPMEGEVSHYLFTDARKPGGGQPTAFYHAFQAFHRHFAPGTPLVRAESSSPDVEVLASAAKALLINKRGEPVEVLLDGQRLSLAAYEVRLADISVPRQ